MIYHISMLNCEFESPYKTRDTTVGHILSWLLCGCLFFFSIPLLNVFCKLYVHKYNSFWQIRAWVNSVCVFYSKTLLKISLATCINNWVILHVWTDFCKRLENIAVNLLTYFHVYCIYLSGHIKPARILRGIDFALSDDFEIWCWNCSDSLVCFDFHIINGTQFV